ncbi:hypothetical protein MKW98_000376 [Papaver atlanticum]|uniref:Uncharacterized protein n=1 Tax=Papaver atlanticum TaxID=357466 RepID=A0AAD4S524_9MAGN|nr:hypothetical protein MKW98_000376 [Papaver atlanticum]
MMITFDDSVVAFTVSFSNLYSADKCSYSLYYSDLSTFNYQLWVWPGTDSPPCRIDTTDSSPALLKYQAELQKYQATSPLQIHMLDDKVQ